MSAPSSVRTIWASCSVPEASVLSTEGDGLEATADGPAAGTDRSAAGTDGPEATAIAEHLIGYD